VLGEPWDRKLVGVEQVKAGPTARGPADRRGPAEAPVGRAGVCAGFSLETVVVEPEVRLLLVGGPVVVVGSLTVVAVVVGPAVLAAAPPLAVAVTLVSVVLLVVVDPGREVGADDALGAADAMETTVGARSPASTATAAIAVLCRAGLRRGK
jgi:hypothetical protein